MLNLWLEHQRKGYRKSLIFYLRWWSWGDNRQNFQACLRLDFLKITTRDCSEAELLEILSLKSEDKQRLNSYALERLNNWQASILSKVSHLGQLSIEQVREDLHTYLYDNEMAEFNKCLADIAGWLSKCMDTGDKYFPDAYDTWVITPMVRTKSLIMKAYQAKEAEERWNAARKAVNPPLSYAKMYLGDKEYDRFIKAARQAIHVYTQKGEDYLGDVRSLDYCQYLELIRNRKEKERQLFIAKLAAQEFNRRLNEEKVRLQALLSPNRKATDDYFRRQVKDRRYMGQQFSQLLSGNEEQDFDKILVGISRNTAEELVSNDFRPFITSNCWRAFFLLPSAHYILEDVPCLGFVFDVFAVVETRLWLKPGQKKFNGYVFDFPWRGEKESSSSKTQEFLGYHYLVLTPEELGCSFWQNIPLVLLKGLLSGEKRPDGTVIVSASDDEVIYEVEGFAEEVEIPTQFTEYLERIGSIDEMVGMGVMTKNVGSIVKAAISELEIKRKVSPAIEKGRRRDSVKERAFHLFNEGKRPGDAEVKSLGIKPNTAYRYYQEWKKTQNHT